MTNNWQKIRLGDVCANVYSGGTPKSTNMEYYGGNIPWLNTKEVHFNRIYQTEKNITEIGLQNSSAKWVPIDSVIVAMYGATAGNIAINKIPLTTNQACCNLIIDNSVANYQFIFYYLLLKNRELASLANGGAQQNLNAQQIKDFEIFLPPLDVQRRIAGVLGALDDKIELNNKINQNLESQAQTLFNKYFSNIFSGEKCIGNYISPKRGKNLLSKDAVIGDVPVIAGGLHPATYHNVANTVAPVITISASGANAGFVNLWHIPVWSSDSSFIDSSITPFVYFWYVMLKLRQNEIFDAQTGSAQPHIYPQHIERIPLSELDIEKVKEYNEIISSLFEKIGYNIKENNTLSKLRDTLLPKLISGEIKV